MLTPTVDFGTTYTGISYVHSLTPSVEDITVITSWPGKAGFKDSRTYDKVPTEISYGRDGSFNEVPQEWGYQLAAGQPRYGCFKLLLDGSLPEIHIRRNGSGGVILEEDIFVDPGNPNAITTPLPAGITAVDISADYLKFVYEHTIDVLKEAMPTTFGVTPLQFVLTTPAVWSHKAQSATLEAAERAGFGSRPNDSILMVSEPEAAANYCLQEQRTNQGVGVEVFNPGNKVVICDCGGGTVDLITYLVEEVRPILKLTEAAVGDGGKYGSTSIDRQFITMLKDRLGGEREFNKLGPRRTGRGGAIMEIFESAKRGFVLGDTRQKWYIPLGNVPDNFEQQIEDGELLLEYDDMESLFENSVTNIIRLLHNQIAMVGARSVSAILLVGGFGQSNYLMRSIENWLSSEFPGTGIRIERPKNAWSAIARGACLHGIEGIVRSRKLKQHYGLKLGIRFREGYHKEEDSFYDDWTGLKYSSNNISWYAEKGDTVQDGERLTIDCQQTSINRPYDKLQLHIYSSNSDMATDNLQDPSVYKLGTYAADLLDLPETAWESKQLMDGNIVYRACFNTVMETGSADIVFKVIYNNKVYGSARMPYVSMGEGLRLCT
ncbi:actin-like ATPase domain-containing protein [Ascobolus immersus RN42]|uniref:Actin-like ATPase domain-containing protein n=1 Tax=Ascobolus immersus RN42 TaxID=1160509 RepID=A0A3N4HWH3_ASCIM|nr:actin-like ATPase domain-containing protein [Ascobolus immersus RN42]